MTEETRLCIKCPEGCTAPHKGRCMCGLDICSAVKAASKELKEILGEPYGGCCLSEIGSGLFYLLPRQDVVEAMSKVEANVTLQVTGSGTTTCHECEARSEGGDELEHYDDCTGRAGLIRIPEE